MNNSADLLVVEDDKGTRVMLSALLEEEGYKIRASQTAEEALNYIMAYKTVDLVLSDLKLPDGSGLQIWWALKKVIPDAAFILVTGHASLDTAIEAVNEGVFAYHVKPLDIDALKNSVRNALRQQRLMAENRSLLERVQLSNNELRGSNQALKEASLAKNQILSTVSHELKTPLTGIVCYVDRMLLQREMVGPLNGRQQRYLESVRENSHRLNAMIDDLLDTSRIESGSLELIPKDLDVGQEIKDVVRSMETLLDEKQILLSLDIPAGLPMVRADKLRFSQVIFNLLSNACKYSPVGAAAAIAAREKGRLIQIEVSDAGMGISKADQSRLFTKFFRADNSSTRETYGTGLGLFISRHIIEAHGGSIWVESEEGRSTTVSFTLPRADWA